MNKDPYSIDAQMNARTSAREWYDVISTNVKKCPFCDLKDKYLIIKGKYGVLTVNIFPYIDGHLMIIPYRHVEKIKDLTAEEWAECLTFIDKAIDSLKEAFKYDNFNVLYREGSKEAGSSLKHFHMHIMPITSDFLKYKDGGFDMEFQRITISPMDAATKLRELIS